MVDILDDLDKMLHSGERFALATVIKTWRSAPRSEGAAMAVNSNGSMVGSVSGGCVEGAVIKEALEVIANGIPRRLSFGVTDADAWTVGLSCGGQIDIWLEVVEKKVPVWDQWLSAVKANEGCILATSLQGEPRHGLYHGDQLSGNLPSRLLPVCREAYRQHKTQIHEDFFLNVFPPKSRLIIVGAAHVSLDLIKLAGWYKFETIVIDPRGIFTAESRFNPTPDQVFEEWPAEVLPGLILDADSYVVVLTHDPKIDDQALQIILKKEVAYVGALGSKKTHEKRRKRLLEAGLSEHEISRIRGPVGIDINAREPAEIALSIMAEIIQVKNQYL